VASVGASVVGVGRIEGERLGEMVGDPVGDTVGPRVGLAVGEDVGIVVGTSVEHMPHALGHASEIVANRS
jgi:hypothetical protein